MTTEASVDCVETELFYYNYIGQQSIYVLNIMKKRAVRSEDTEQIGNNESHWKRENKSSHDAKSQGSTIGD